jgi:hypothetical protein
MTIPQQEWLFLFISFCLNNVFYLVLCENKFYHKYTFTMIHRLLLLLTFATLFFNTKAQNLDSIRIDRHESIPLTISTPIVIKAIPNSTDKSLQLLGRQLAIIFLDNINCATYIGEAQYKLAPETYNISISLIKDRLGKVIGMTKKYENVHLVRLGKKMYKFEYLKSGKNILTELSDAETEAGSPNKIMTISGYGQNMDIFHNLDSVPIALIPIILNTRKINKQINTKAVAGVLVPLAILALRIFIQNNI